MEIFADSVDVYTVIHALLYEYDIDIVTLYHYGVQSTGMYQVCKYS